MKTCSKCLQEKSLDSFYNQPLSQPTKDGKTYWCKACYAQNYRDNVERQKLSNRVARLKRNYGLTLEEYQALVTGPCSICGTTERKRVIDHNHRNGKVRAALCNNCNCVLGYSGDDPHILIRAAEYLQRHGDLAHDRV